MRELVVRAGLMAIVASISACGAEAPEGGASMVVDPVVYVGSVLTSKVGAVEAVEMDTVVALSVGEHESVLYFCGGEATVDTRTNWVDPIETDALLRGSPLTTHAGGWEVEITLSDDKARGTARLVEGDQLVELTWEATPLLEDSIGGLYQAGSGCRTGAVVTDVGDGNVSVQGAYCDALGHLAQVTPILPVSLDAAGDLTVRISASDRFEDVVLKRVSHSSR